MLVKTTGSYNRNIREAVFELLMTDRENILVQIECPWNYVPEDCQVFLHQYVIEVGYKFNFEWIDVGIAGVYMHGYYIYKKGSHRGT